MVKLSGIRRHVDAANTVGKRLVVARMISGLSPEQAAQYASFTPAQIRVMEADARETCSIEELQAPVTHLLGAVYMVDSGWVASGKVPDLGAVRAKVALPKPHRADDLDDEVLLIMALLMGDARE